MSVDMSTTMPKYESYKDSGTDWIGYIPAHWELKRLKFIDTVKMGQSPDSNDCNDLEMGLPFLQGNAEFGLEHPTPRLWCIRPKKISSKGDLLFSVRAPVGAINRSDQKYCIGRGLAAITVNCSHKALRKFQLLASVESFKKLLTGSTFEAISTDDLKNLLLCIPNEGEIALITKFLDKKTTQIDEAIAIKEQQIALLKERKQIIIQKAVTQGLDPTVPMKDSGVDWIGEIPAHWEIKKVKNIFRLVMEPSEKNNDHELLSVYTDIGVKPRRELEERGNKASTTDGYWLVKKGDIVVNKLLAWMGAIGLSEYNGVTSPAYDILRPELPLNGYFYHHLFRSEFCSAELKRHSRGIMDMRLRLYFDKFGVIEVPYPSADEQDEIIHALKVKMSEMDEGIDHLKAQIANLKEYKTTLINSAVTGKIRITPDMVEA